MVETTKRVAMVKTNDSIHGERNVKWQMCYVEQSSMDKCQALLKLKCSGFRMSSTRMM